MYAACLTNAFDSEIADCVRHALKDGDNGHHINLPTCCSVNFLATVSLPAWILWVDKANMRSSKLQPSKPATLVHAAIKV